MSRQKSEFVSAFGTSFEIFQKLAGAVYDAGGNDDDLRKLLSDEAVRHRVSKLLVGELSVIEPREYKVSMVRRTLAEGIRSGAYHYVNADIKAECFRADAHPPGTELKAVFVELRRELPRERLDAEFARYNLRHGTLTELLAFETAFPDALPKLTLFALGSSWTSGGFTSSPYVCDRVHGAKCEVYRVLDMAVTSGKLYFERTRYLGIRR